jgi:hypothetical protein
MLTDALRDHSFTIAWFGLMTFVWLGWSQEDPEKRMRPILGVGSAIGLALSIWFGVVTQRNWFEATALEGRYHWLGVLVGAEVVVALLGALVLARRQQGRWMAWWVALVVALHFIPLGLLLADVTVLVLGVLQAVALLALVPLLRRAEFRTSRVVGPVMGFSLLAYAVVSAIVFLVTR